MILASVRGHTNNITDGSIAKNTFESSVLCSQIEDEGREIEHSGRWVVTIETNNDDDILDKNK